MDLQLDIGNILAENVGSENGLRREDLEGLAEDMKTYAERIEKRRGKDVGFMELPYDEQLADQINCMADQLRRWCRNFVVLGIGGSALGNITVHRALNHPFHNMLPIDHPARGGAPRIFVMDNVDPWKISGLMDIIKEEIPQTAFNVITKSGGTAETMSQFLSARELLENSEGADPAQQIIATTDTNPEKSLLKRMAQEAGYETLPIPDNVGGRFSVLSAVGLLSAAVSGVDIDGLFEGARRADKACRVADMSENPAAQFAAALYLQHQNGKPMNVLMPYSEALSGLSDWFCQLWAESLGKRKDLDGHDVFRGPTPVPSVGVTDQHSTMQLYQDGPFDKVICFVEVADPGVEEQPICSEAGESELDYFEGKTCGELFGSELEATRAALRTKNKPNCTVRVPAVTPEALGELFMFFEYAVTFSSFLYNVNAFDQPGVELGKQYTYGLMGRKGYNPPPQA